MILLGEKRSGSLARIVPTPNARFRHLRGHLGDTNFGLVLTMEEIGIVQLISMVTGTG